MRQNPVDQALECQPEDSRSLHPYDHTLLITWKSLVIVRLSSPPNPMLLIIWKSLSGFACSATFRFILPSRISCNGPHELF